MERYIIVKTLADGMKLYMVMHASTPMTTADRGRATRYPGECYAREWAAILNKTAIGGTYSYELF